MKALPRSLKTLRLIRDLSYLGRERRQVSGSARNLHGAPAYLKSHTLIAGIGPNCDRVEKRRVVSQWDAPWYPKLDIGGRKTGIDLSSQLQQPGA